jgi:serine-type D-Ala-D-Ala carboxypeptidase/endopeptidase (penicillin-binding protein 4)
MKKFFICIIIFFVATISAKQSQFLEKLKKEESKKNIDIGIIISNPESNKILFEQQANHYFLPASTIKIITAFAGIYYLGQNFHFDTSILINTNKLLADGTLHDNLYLKFSGDPSLTLHDLDNLFSQANKKGIKKITGKIRIDDTSQDHKLWSIGTVAEDKKFCFCSPISAIIINSNCINAEAKILANKKVVLSGENLNLVTLMNNLSYSDKITNADLEVNDQNEYHLIGKIQKDTPLKIAVQNNREFSIRAISSLLSKYHIATTNKFEFRRVPPNYSIYVNHESRPLGELLKIMLKESDNTIANAIFKTLGKYGDNPKDSWSAGSLAVKNMLYKKLNIPPDSLSIKDGAGCSIYNLVSPKQMITVLNYLHSDRNVHFKEMLPIAGTDGTLKDRMTNPKIKVNAKTGTETGISSLAGYIYTRKHHLLSFVIMINNALQPDQELKALEDIICYLIYESF